MAEILKFPNQLLTEKMPEFDFSNPIRDPKELEKQMLETMYANKGIGMAANQFGIKTRMFVMGDKPGNGKGIFNPIILEAHNVVEDEEGCLSFPGIYVKVKRPSAIKARWQNSSGEWEEGEISGYSCKCFLHEYDHLEGITFQDRTSTLKWALAVKKSKKRKI